jgi:uncharacterized protein YndB with AHSA1/START domain
MADNPNIIDRPTDRIRSSSMTSFDRSDTFSVSHRAFVISRIFDAPPDILFKAFTVPEHIKKWWGPKGCEVIAAKLDLRPGGTFHYGLRTPDGGTMWGRFVYREIVAPHRIVLISAFSDASGGVTRHPMSATWPLETLSTFRFTEHLGRTNFTVEASPLNPTPLEQATFDGARENMRGGWTGTMDQLAAYLAETHVP